MSLFHARSLSPSLPKRARMVQGVAHDAHLAPSPETPAPKAAENKAVPKIAKMVKVVKAEKVVAKVATAAKVVKAAHSKPTDKEVRTSIPWSYSEGVSGSDI